ARKSRGRAGLSSRGRVTRRKWLFDARRGQPLQPRLPLGDDTATADKHHAPVRRRELQLATLDGVILGLVPDGRIGYAQFVKHLHPRVERASDARECWYVFQILDNSLRQLLRRCLVRD